MPRALGSVATAATTEAAVNSTVYTEPTNGAQRALVSASANDAAAGTGARTVRIHYYTLAADGTIAGPFTETVTLNGTTPVPTVATNIALIDRMVVLTAGSAGTAVPVGVVSLTVNNDGSGGTIASIGTTERRTFLTHAYVPSGRRCNITDIIVTSGEASTVQTRFSIRQVPYGVASGDAIERDLTAALAVQGLTGIKQELPGGQPLAVVAGPARIQMYTIPGAATSVRQRAEFGFYYT